MCLMPSRCAAYDPASSAGRSQNIRVLFSDLSFFRVQNASHPQGPFYEGNRSVLDILRLKTAQIFSERRGCEVCGLFLASVRSGSADLGESGRSAAVVIALDAATATSGRNFPS